MLCNTMEGQIVYDNSWVIYGNSSAVASGAGGACLIINI